jgi:transposase-like protein
MSMKEATMAKRRKFTAEFKARVVLEVLSGMKSPADICRQYDLQPPLLSIWKATFLANAEQIFQADARLRAAQERIAELERLVGQQALELQTVKKASTLLSSSLTSSTSDEREL